MPAMKIQLFDTPFFFFLSAFGGFSNYAFTIESSSSTQIVISQAGGGPVTTINGTGMVFDGTGALIEAGTITGMVFSSSTSPVASINNISWSVASLNTALIDLAAGDETGITALFAAQNYTIDGTGMSGFIDNFHLGTFIANTVTNVIGSAQSDYIFGNAQANNMFGAAGDDFIGGGDGKDILGGGAGKDTIDGGLGGDTIRGGIGNDTLSGNEGGDRILGNGGRDKLFGNTGNDKLLGNGGNDRLVGGSGRDKLFGGAGNDNLQGGRGNDVLTGNADSDVFIYSGAGNEGNDRITDFQDGTDFIKLGSGTVYGDLTIAASGATDTLISIAGVSTTILVQGVDSGLFDQSDFIFV
jgi:Ca2+-binding RTX toxin-like protein